MSLEWAGAVCEVYMGCLLVSENLNDCQEKEVHFEESLEWAGAVCGI